MSYKQFIFAREYRGFTQTELAKNIQGLSQSNLSKFEKGFDTLSDENVDKIIDFLKFPKSFFDRKIKITIDNSNYRKKIGTKKKDIAKFEKKCEIVGYMIDELADTIDWVDYSLPFVDMEDDYSINNVADHIRRQLKISEDEPVRDIMRILENAGILIYEIEALEGFDGISFYTSKGYPVIIINKFISNDRKRFTLAHELGHLVMHNENKYLIPNHRDKEKEANMFASQFLMPEKYIKNSLRGIRLGDLGILKKYWLTSKASIIKRAKDLNCIDSNKATYFNIELSRSGERKKEKEMVFIDTPNHIKKSYQLLSDDLGYKQEDFENYFALPSDVIKDILNFDNIPILRII